MIHKKARQREVSKKWDYTCRHKNDVYPIGYCAGDSEDNRSFYHANGHTSAEEACDCYKNYLLNNSFNKGTHDNVQYKCIECGEWTSHYVTIGFGVCSMLNLCERHLTKDVASKHFDVGESYES